MHKKKTERGAVLIELSLVMIVMAMTAFGFISYSRYVSTKMFATNVTSVIAYRMRLVCEIYPPFALDSCLEDIQDQVQPILNDNGFEFGIVMKVFERTGSSVTVIGQRSFGTNPASSLTTGFIGSGESGEILNLTRRAYTVEARYRPMPYYFTTLLGLKDISIA